MSKILVTGGAGYIGSHLSKMLHENGYQVVVLDNLSTGHREAVLNAEFVEGDIGDAALLDKLFSAHEFVGVMHFAAYIQVGDSVQNPSKYYQNNLVNTLTLLHKMLAHNIKRLVFSSTAAVYGEPQYIPIDEKHPIQPVNPYGNSKAMIEQVLRDYDLAYGLKSISLRYFNAAGADPNGKLGEYHEPETHLIPLVLQVAKGQCSAIEIYGNDYNTPDGTCIRDYIHVTDLCQAHLLALKALLKGAESAVFNLGNGQGFSVQEVIHAAREVTGHPIPQIAKPRRAGDPARLVADSRAAREKLGWTPIFQDLKNIIEHAWQWEKKRS